MISGSDRLDGVVGEGSLLGVVSCGEGVSDEMMRNDGAEEVSCFRCPMIAVFLSFLFFPIVSPDPLSSALLDLLA